MAKKSSTKTAKQPSAALSAASYLGLIVSLAGFAAVLAGALLLFVPGLNITSSIGPSKLLLILFATGVAGGFVGTVLSMIGFNAHEIMARLAFLFSVLAFIVGGALMLVILFFRTFLPLSALDALSAVFK